MITSGSNTKKKNAKHLASEYMLRSLQERGMVKGLRVPEKPFLGESDDNFDNPTSKLFEFVQIRGLIFILLSFKLKLLTLAGKVTNFLSS